MTDSKKCEDITKLTSVLKNFGVSDPDWLAIVLFVRNLLAKLSVYTDEKKAEIQREIFAELTKRDFSQEHFTTVIAMLDMYVMQTIGTLELEEALAQEKRSAVKLLNEMTDIIGSMHGNNNRQFKKLDAFKERTVGVIKSGDDKSVIVARVREMFKELIVEFKEEAKELHARAQMLEHTANFDPMLTELHNRRALDAYIRAAVEEQRKQQTHLSLLMIDVDHFKRVNDTYGHQAGDDVLHALARIISAHAVPYQGFTARYGGEELVIIMKDIPEALVELKAEELRAEVENYDFRIRQNGKLADDPLQFTVSIGIAHWRRGLSESRLIANADKALYVAKEEGRNQVRMFRV